MTPPATTSLATPPAGTGADPVLRLRGAAIGHGTARVVRDLDLEVRAGESVAVLGANGSGKSTLVKGLLGLADVQDGTVELFGQPVGSFHQRWRIGYVPQRHTVGGPVPSSVREVVASGRLARRPWWRPAGSADRTAVDDAIEVVGLSEQARRPVAELSGGQQRRVLVARALAAEPEVLLMDEPTAGVDASQQRALARALQVLVGRAVTMLVVTHEVGPLAGVVRRAVVMEEGRLRYDGPLLAEMLPGGHEHVHHHDEPAPQGAGWVAEPRIGG